LAVGAGAVNSQVQSLFLGPVTQEFHWTRGQFFIVSIPATMVGAVVMPLLGLAADRWGIRKVHIPGIVAYGLMNMALVFLTGNMWQYLGFMIIHSAFAMWQSPPLYAKATAAWADKRRGLALAICMVGNGVGNFITPPICAWLIHNYGWRGGRIGMGLLVILVAVPAVYFFIQEPPKTKQRAAFIAAQEGMTGWEAVQTPTFWMLLVITFLTGAATVGITANLFPLLRGNGIDPQLSVWILSFIAVGQTGGRFLFGWLLDKFQTPKVGALMILCVIGGIGLLFVSSNAVGLTAGALLHGVGGGVELEIAAYYGSRYFGMKYFGTIYGLIFGGYIVGLAVGQTTVGALSDIAHNYNWSVMAAEAAAIISTLLVLVLGPYKYKPRKETAIDDSVADAEALAEIPKPA
jgi:MFS family permease